MKLLSRLAFVVCIASPISAFADTLWKPSDYNRVWVTVSDNVKNGCWTNIGEFRQYAEDQLYLAGFEVVDEPKVEKDVPSPLLEEGTLSLFVSAKGSRWSDGTCVGALTGLFVGAIVPVSNQEVVAVNPIGFPSTWPVWSEDNFNTIALDFAKGIIPHWVEEGEIEVRDQ